MERLDRQGAAPGPPLAQFALELDKYAGGDAELAASEFLQLMDDRLGAGEPVVVGAEMTTSKYLYEQASGVYQTVSDGVSRAADSAKELVTRTAEGLKEGGRRVVTQGAQDAYDGLRQTNPAFKDFTDPMLDGKSAVPDPAYPRRGPDVETLTDPQDPNRRVAGAARPYPQAAVDRLPAGDQSRFKAIWDQLPFGATVPGTIPHTQGRFLQSLTGVKYNATMDSVAQRSLTGVGEGPAPEPWKQAGSGRDVPMTVNWNVNGQGGWHPHNIVIIGYDPVSESAEYMESNGTRGRIHADELRKHMIGGLSPA